MVDSKLAESYDDKEMLKWFAVGLSCQLVEPYNRYPLNEN